MLCKQCPDCERLSTRYQCRLSGAQVWPGEDRYNRQCPATLILDRWTSGPVPSSRMVLGQRSVNHACGVAVIADERGQLGNLLAHYNPREQTLLRHLVKLARARIAEDRLSRLRRGKQPRDPRRHTARAGRKRADGRVGGWGKGTVV